MKINEQRREKFFRILIIVLIIIILILFFFSKFGRINDYCMPTGNVDVFDITINCNHKKNIVDSVIARSTTTTLNSNTMTATAAATDSNEEEGTNIPIYNEDKDKNIIGQVFVDDKNGDYLYQQRLEIFNNAAYQYTNKIAPGVFNTYHFVVHNSSNVNVKYYIEMYEESEYKVNLKYRLKRNNKYILGNENNWVTADELKTSFEYISMSSSDSYSLDWKWFDDKNEIDTIAGENMTSLYKLNIRVHFEALES